MTEVKNENNRFLAHAFCVTRKKKISLYKGKSPIFAGFTTHALKKIIRRFYFSFKEQEKGRHDRDFHQLQRKKFLKKCVVSYYQFPFNIAFANATSMSFIT